MSQVAMTAIRESRHGHLRIHTRASPSHRMSVPEAPRIPYFAANSSKTVDRSAKCVRSSHRVCSHDMLQFSSRPEVTAATFTLAPSQTITCRRLLN